MMIRGITVFLALFVLTVHPLGARGESLDRLFFTPEERHYLEQLRRATADSAPPVEEKKEAEVVLDEKAAYVTMGGMVKRGAKVQAVWLNGAPRSVKALPPHVRLGSRRTAGQIDVMAPATGKSYPLRAGQTLELGSGRILESYEGQQEKAVDGPLPEEPAAVPGVIKEAPRNK